MIVCLLSPHFFLAVFIVARRLLTAARLFFLSRTARAVPAARRPVAVRRTLAATFIGATMFAARTLLAPFCRGRACRLAAGRLRRRLNGRCRPRRWRGRSNGLWRNFQAQ